MLTGKHTGGSHETASRSVHTRSMNETPSGNRWEPGDDDTPRPRSETPVPARRSTGLDAGEPPSVRLGAGCPPTHLPPRLTRGRRRAALLAAGAAALVLAAGTGGYALSSVGAGAGDDLGSHQTSDDGSFPGHGIPGADGDDDHADLPDGRR